MRTTHCLGNVMATAESPPPHQHQCVHRRHKDEASSPCCGSSPECDRKGVAVARNREHTANTQKPTRQSQIQLWRMGLATVNE